MNLGLLKKYIVRPSTMWISLGAIVFAYAGLTLATITKASIWFDEAFSAYLTRFNIFEIAWYTGWDVHPPAYYWVLKGWTTIFGTSELAFRSMSMFFGMVTIVFGFLIVKKFFGKKAALLAALFMALSPMLIRYGQEARMYTMASSIALAGTWALIEAVKTKSKKAWWWYSGLVALGMWTHYFTALVWISHVLWRLWDVYRSGARGKKIITKSFEGGWFKAYKWAVILYSPWVFVMLAQLVLLQAFGFWIPPVGIDTLPNLVTTMLFYVEDFQAHGWMAISAIVIVSMVAWSACRAYKNISKQDRWIFSLLGFSAFAGMVLLFVASLPPLTSSFVDRYLALGAIPLMLMFGAVSIVKGFQGLKYERLITAVITLIIVSSMLVGVKNVYYYGNYNRVSDTHVNVEQVVDKIKAVARPGEPIIADSPWIFYEAVFYNDERNPMYFIDEKTEYKYGSLKMLQSNDDFKIKDIDAFLQSHKTVWYIGGSLDEQILPPYDNWKRLDSVSETSTIDGKTQYKASRFEVK